MKTFKILSFVIVLVFLAFAFKFFEFDKKFFSTETSYPEFEILDGKQYIPINIAEMILLMDSGKVEKSDNRYVARGMIYRNEKLDSKIHFGFVRVVLTCCVADAVPFGIKVAYHDIENFKDGEWVKIYGTFKKNKVHTQKNNDENPTVKPDNFNIVDRYFFVPDKIEKIELPPDPYITNWKEEAPYVY